MNDSTSPSCSFTIVLDDGKLQHGRPGQHGKVFPLRGRMHGSGNRHLCDLAYANFTLAKSLHEHDWVYHGPFKRCL
jgi:hypothetical protein